MNNITEDALSEGYFKDNTKTIILNIITLIDLGLIKNNISIDELKDSSTTNVFNLIKKLEFNEIKNDEIKKLIK